MFICGSGSITNQVEQESNNSPCSTPKRPKKNISFCKRNTPTTKNPYADRGLDKFYALLADLDSKKQKIYTQKGSEDISFVRFVYTNESDNVTPIVVKVKDKKKSLTDQRSFKSVNSEAPEKVVAPGLEMPASVALASPAPERRGKRRRCLIKSCNESFKLVDLKHPKFCLAVMVVLILVFLAMYGRSFAIMCTSIGWYLTPTIVGASNSSSVSDRKPKRKKEFVRRQSAPIKSVGPSSPKSVINGLQQQSEQQQHDRKKSW